MVLSKLSLNFLYRLLMVTWLPNQLNSLACPKAVLLKCMFRKPTMDKNFQNFAAWKQPLKPKWNSQRGVSLPS